MKGDEVFFKPLSAIPVYKTILGFMALIFLFMAGCPYYSVYTAKMHGQAEYQRATYNRQIKVVESEATKISAINLADADTFRAHGIARSNAIIGESLKNNPQYLYWLWIDNLDKNQNVIYVATEANMPIMEAGRLNELNRKKDTLQKQ